MKEYGDSKKRARGPDKKPRRRVTDPAIRKRQLRGLPQFRDRPEEELDAILAKAEADAPDVARQVTENILEDPQQRTEFETLWRGLAEGYRMIGSEKAGVQRRVQDLALSMMCRRILLLRAIADRISAAAANYTSLIVQRTEQDLDRYRKRSEDAPLAWAFAAPLKREADGNIVGGSFHFAGWEAAVGPLKDAVGQRLLSAATPEEGRIWREVWDLVGSPPETWNALPGVAPEEILADLREQAVERKREYQGSRYREEAAENYHAARGGDTIDGPEES